MSARLRRSSRCLHGGHLQGYGVIQLSTNHMQQAETVAADHMQRKPMEVMVAVVVMEAMAVVVVAVEEEVAT